MFGNPCPIIEQIFYFASDTVTALVKYFDFVLVTNPRMPIGQVYENPTFRPLAPFLSTCGHQLSLGGGVRSARISGLRILFLLLMHE